jgi:dTDP-4-dehydrorhamnose reductase
MVVNDMLIAVSGHKGRLGQELVQRGCVPLDCNITSKVSIRMALKETKPDIVIHCAAVTDVDYCEKNQEEAFEINAAGTENLKVCFSETIIYLSTDYIFDGKKGMYSEEDEPAEPSKLCWYGYTKLLGEQLLGNRDTIIRTTMLYGSPMKMDFVTHILQKLELDEPFEVTRALYGTPTYVPHLAEAIMTMLNSSVYYPDIINIVGSDYINRYDFALMIASFFGHEDKKELIIPTLKTGKTKRPRKAGLKTDQAKKMGLPIYSVLKGLEAFHTRDKIEIFKQLGMEI